MEFGILGQLIVRKDRSELPLGPPQQRALLAVLILRRGEPVPTARLVDELWGERPPPAAVKTVQVYVSRLRKALGDGVLTPAPLGYVLQLGSGSLDAEEFERLLDEGRSLLAAGDAHAATEVLGRALGLWRGPALADFRYQGFARDEIGRLEELRLLALEQRVKADVALGRHVEAVPELEGLVSEHPLHERFRGLLMLALYRSGRQADALAVYQDARTALVEELGLDPSEELRQLEAAILRHDRSLNLVAAEPPQPDNDVAVEEVLTRARNRSRVALAVGAAAAVAVVVAVAAAVLVTHGGQSPGAAGVSADSVGIFGAGASRPSGQVAVGASPSAVTVGRGSIWVANGDANTVSRINPTKQVSIDTISVGHDPDAIAFGDGFLWVANGLDGTVSKIDPDTDTRVDTIAVGNGPAGVAVGARYVWVANASDGTVTRIDWRTDRPLPPIAVAQSADGVAVGYGSAWVTSQAAGTVTRIDASTGRLIEPIRTGSGADAVATGAGAVWVANSLDSTVTRIDRSTDRVVTVIPVGDGPNGIAAVDGAVWVSDELGGTVTRIDPLRNIPVGSIATRNRPEGVAVDAGSLFVAVRGSGVGHRGGKLTLLTSSGDLSHVDPALDYSQTELQVAALAYDGLTGFRRVGGDAGLRLVPDLAVSKPAPTDGGRSYTFQLRPGIRYSTGAPVQPADFRRAIERSLRLPGPGYYFADVDGAGRCLAEPKQPCDLSRGILTDAASNTVTFHLATPDPDFLYQLTLPAAAPVPAGTPLHLDGFVPATGPYKIASYDPKTGMRLVRNPRFREWSPAAQPSGFPDEIVERVSGSTDANVSDAARGLADDASVGLNSKRPSPAALAFVRTQHASQFELNPWDVTWYLALNTRIPPFDSLAARRALNLAVDRERLRDLTVGSGLGTVTCQILPPALTGYRPYCPSTAGPSADGAWTAPDLARARRLVRSSGTAGEAVTVWLPTMYEQFAGAAGRAAGSYVVSVLDSLGYKARYRFAHNPFVHEDKLHLQLGFNGWYPDFASPSGFINPLLTCRSYNRDNTLNENAAEFCNPRIDHEIAQARSLQTTDPAATSALWAQIDRDLTDQAPWVPYANGVALDVVSTRVSNYQLNPQLGTLLDQLWIK